MNEREKVANSILSHIAINGKIHLSELEQITYSSDALTILRKPTRYIKHKFSNIGEEPYFSYYIFTPEGEEFYRNGGFEERRKRLSRLLYKLGISVVALVLVVVVIEILIKRVGW